MPDDFFRVDGLAVYDGGNLPVRAAGVKTDAAAVRVTADANRLLIGGKITVYETRLRGEAFAAANIRFAERLVKMLLWSAGRAA